MADKQDSADKIVNSDVPMQATNLTLEKIQEFAKAGRDMSSWLRRALGPNQETFRIIASVIDMLCSGIENGAIPDGYRVDQTTADLHSLCAEFVHTHQIATPEDCHRSDAVADDAAEFIEKICNLIGYAAYESK